MRLLLTKILRKIGLHLSRFDELPYGIRDEIKRFVGLHADVFTGKVLDIGSAEWSYIKDTFSDTAQVTTFDIRPPADVIGSISQAPFSDSTFDTVVCLEVLEHVRDIFGACKEMHRILKPGGTLLASTPFIYELHGEEYGDYWRITRQGWELLLHDFVDVTITPYGKYPNRFPNMYLVTARKP
jgi:SAM-dependent methyltransferase